MKAKAATRGWLHRVWRGLLWCIGAAFFALLAVQLWYAGHIWWWKTHPPGRTAFMHASLERLQAIRPDARLKHFWVDYPRIADPLKRAVLVAEDARFNEHEGFDFAAIKKALEKNRQRGKVVAGGSTISQQLAKNLFLTGERSKLRKAQEAVITVMLEQILDKERILEIYLNVIEWGDGVFGAEAAARHYFSKSAQQLTAWEAARLAAMVPRPRYYERNRNTPYLLARTAWILAQMQLVEVP